MPFTSVVYLKIKLDQVKISVRIFRANTNLETSF